MPTWLLGKSSVSTDSGSGTKEFYGATVSGQGQGEAGTFGVGQTFAVGLARIGPPGSGGTTYKGALGVGLGGLSPGSLSICVVSVRNQLFPGPATTSGGGVYQRSPGVPSRARETNSWTPGDATKTPSEPPIML